VSTAAAIGEDRRLIVTADDFGVAVPVNEAVEEGHSRGILSAASLMVAAPAAGDAVERARRLPNLGVGLHLVLVDGQPVLPPEKLPDLVGPDGRFPKDALRMGIKIFCNTKARVQAENEIHAQFAAFRKTGLRLDHLNGHHHFHVHPTVQQIILKLAPKYGVKAVRVPHEPFLASWRATGEQPVQRFLAWLVHWRRAWWMKRRLRQAGIGYNDHIFGLVDSGQMLPGKVAWFLAGLPPGLSEVYCHPATSRYEGADALPETYEPVGEFNALIDPAVIEAMKRLGLKPVPFAGA
jgi:hopanoid biosynthesis associated protein HpnK